MFFTYPTHTAKSAEGIPLTCLFKLNVDFSGAFIEEPLSTFFCMNMLCHFKREREVMWSLLRRCWKYGTRSGLVNISVTCSREGKCWMESWWFRTFSQMKWTSSSICLVWAWNMGLLARAIEPWLSHQNIGWCRGKTCNSWRNYWTRVSFAVVVARHWYSTSVEERETMCGPCIFSLTRSHPMSRPTFNLFGENILFLEKTSSRHLFLFYFF